MYGNTLSRPWLAFWCALLLATSSLEALPQSSPPILPGSELLWSSLNEIAQTLPSNFDSFMASLTDQVNSLQASNQSLTETNEQLQASNSSLMLKNADLTNSLAISKQAVATSESKSERLQKGIDASTASITQLKTDIAGIQRQNTIWKITTAAGIIGTIAAVIWALAK
jgi:hypothetical protein